MWTKDTPEIFVRVSCNCNGVAVDDATDYRSVAATTMEASIAVKTGSEHAWIITIYSVVPKMKVDNSVEV